MTVFNARVRLAAALAVALIGASAPLSAAATKSAGAAPLLPGANSRQPVSIEADKLVYYDKEQKAVYTGKVVVIQGDTKMTCSAMTIYMEKAAASNRPEAAAASDPAKAGDAGAAAPGASTSHVKHLDAVGPVTVVSKTQVATGDNASYDKAQNKVWLIGNVTLSDGGNVTKGDKLTYDLTTGEATVDTGAAANRVKGLFIPGSSDSGDDDKTKQAK
ncbi:MAG: LptA/OstA family protein [Roseiarcus sp.]|jgi:lipopolysaccharide export system protein LptA